MLRAAFLALLCLALASGPPLQKPDFSGTWAAEKMALNFDGVAGGSVIRIEQDAKSIRIRRSYGREGLGNPPVVLAISLDGKENPITPYPTSHRPGLSGALSIRATWDGNRIIIVSTRTVTDTQKKTSNKTETTETLSLDGRRLIVERVERATSAGKGAALKEIWTRQ